MDLVHEIGPWTPGPCFVLTWWVLVYSFCLISIGLQNLQSSLTFCHPIILQFLIAAIFFANDCKEFKLEKTA